MIILCASKACLFLIYKWKHWLFFPCWWSCSSYIGLNENETLQPFHHNPPHITCLHITLQKLHKNPNLWIRLLPLSSPGQIPHSTSVCLSNPQILQTERWASYSEWSLNYKMSNLYAFPDCKVYLDGRTTWYMMCCGFNIFYVKQLLNIYYYIILYLNSSKFSKFSQVPKHSNSKASSQNILKL